MIGAETLAQPGLRHGFFTREGGVSTGLYASLNCGYGSGDDRNNVTENRRRAANALGVSSDRLITCHQIHSASVVTVDAPWRPENAPQADAMVTARPGLALGILAADCAPVLFADATSRIIGACHAGWRGALGGVIGATVTEMVRLGARRERICAAIGPCIAKTSYEVGPGFPAPFLADDPEAAAFFAPAERDGHFLFDLAFYVAARLRRLDIAVIGITGGDTASDETRFFSYRRSCLRGEPDYGRLVSAIAITDS